MKTHSLKTRLTLMHAAMVLVTVVLISFLSNYFINRKFLDYVALQQRQKTGELVASLGQQYHPGTAEWDVDFIHTLGMYALYDGYIIKVSDLDSRVVWDAQNHDMTTCAQVMAEIQERMERKYPSVNGEFTSTAYPLTQAGSPVGSVEIGYFGPFFLSEEDFNFLETLNAILLVIALFSLALSAVIGRYIAGRMSRPILQTADAARKLAGGDYLAQIDGDTGTRELNDLILSINHLADSLSRQESLRSQLTADVAHELRTPLTTMGTHLEAMLLGVWEPTPQRLQSCLEETGRLTGLVADLESLAKVEADNLRLAPERLDYRQEVDRCLESMGMELERKRLTVRREGESVTVLADPGRLRQVIGNLLSNAVKYTPEGGEISIRLAEECGHTILQIRDTGPGIPQEELPKIFERFYRADKSRNRETGGSGIGLAIVKSIVAAHRGTVEAQSAPGGGCCFTVRLPG